MSAKLKTETGFFLPAKLVAALSKAAKANDSTVDSLVANALKGYVRMLTDLEYIPERWAAMPLDIPTEKDVEDLAKEDGEPLSLYLQIALSIHLDNEFLKKKQSVKS